MRYADFLNSASDWGDAGLVSLRRGTDLALLNIAFGKWSFSNAGLVDFVRLTWFRRNAGLRLAFYKTDAVLVFRLENAGLASLLKRDADLALLVARLASDG